MLITKNQVNGFFYQDLWHPSPPAAIPSFHQDPDWPIDGKESERDCLPVLKNIPVITYLPGPVCFSLDNRDPARKLRFVFILKLTFLIRKQIQDFAIGIIRP